MILVKVPYIQLPLGYSLYANAGLLCTAAESTGSGVIGILIKAAGTYPSGVPGIDLNGDQALGGDNSNTYLELKLTI